MKYADASALLRVLFREPGPHIPLDDDDERVVSSELVEIEAFRALDRLRLVGALDDAVAAQKRAELTNLLRAIDVAAIDRRVVDLAKSSFGVNVRTLDAIHVATAQVLMQESGDESLTFWTHDERQATAALARGLDVRGT